MSPHLAAGLLWASVSTAHLLVRLQIKAAAHFLEGEMSVLGEGNRTFLRVIQP